VSILCKKRGLAVNPASGDLSRNGLPQQAAIPVIVAGLQRSLHKPAIVDGEIVCFDEQGQRAKIVKRSVA
jgi:hypothetical protein